MARLDIAARDERRAKSEFTAIFVKGLLPVPWNMFLYFPPFCTTSIYCLATLKWHFFQVLKHYASTCGLTYTVCTVQPGTQPVWNVHRGHVPRRVHLLSPVAERRCVNNLTRKQSPWVRQKNAVWFLGHWQILMNVFWSVPLLCYGV